MTLFPFVVPTSGSYQFSPVLDGSTYVAKVTWNIYGARWYIAISDTIGNLVMYRPVVASPPEYGINLLNGYFFKSSLVYRAATSNFEVTP